MIVQVRRYVEIDDIASCDEVRDIFENWSRDDLGMVYLEVVSDRLEGCEDFAGEFAEEQRRIAQAMAMGAEYMDYGRI